MQLFIKKANDILFSLLAILMLLPFWFLIGLLIFIEDRGPIFYKQKRLGKNETVFTLYKFRSMKVNNIPPLELGSIKHNHSLVTKMGYIIRRFKLDETPQFLNVLFGQMSLVGPRPCLPERLTNMSTLQKKRFTVLPGLTGWAEVNGNVELSWSEQINLDMWYVKNWTNRLDIYILIKTLWVVLVGSRRNEQAILRARELCEYS